MKNSLRYFIIVISLCILWQSVVLLFQLPDYILPTPLDVILALCQQSALIMHEAIPTLIETSLGFIFGILFGLSAGALTSLFKPMRLWFLPLLIISQAIPTFAIAPLIVLWLGYGIASKIAITVLMIFFPIASSFYDGLRRTPAPLLDLAKTLQATPARLFFFIRVPAALPSLSSGMRIAAVSAPLGAIVGEWVGSSQGLGYLMLTANARMQIDLMFAALIVIIALALSLYFCVDKLLNKLLWWHCS